MGHKDTVALHKIYDIARFWCKKHKHPYQFRVDDGDYETALEFFFLGEAKTPQWEVIHPPRSLNWDSNPTIICPDILDYHSKIIIEYDEEGGQKRPGATLAPKGHGPEGDILTGRDERRGDYYSFGKFRFLRFYEKDLREENWEKIYSFLLDCVVEDMKNSQD